MKYLYSPETFQPAGWAPDDIDVPHWLPVPPPDNTDPTKVVVADPTAQQWVIVELSSDQIAAQLAAVKSSALQRIAAYAGNLRSQIAGTPDAGEMAGWSNKLRIAMAIQANTASDADKAAFQAEIALRAIPGETLDSFTAKVLSNAAFFTHAVALIDGLKRKAQDAVNSATSAADVANVLTNMKAAADSAFARLMQGAG